MQLSRKSLLLLLLSAVYPATAAEPDGHLVPKELEEQDLQVHHHLSKRQLPQCLHYFLAEPPQRIQCLPTPNILPLECRFLVGQVTNFPQILTISWFFSRDGIQAQWVQSARFELLNTYVAFLNRLTVLNPLPGAYFCSVTVPNRLFDTAVLRVNSTTLQTMCLPEQSPIFLQPTAPRCATIGVPIDLRTLQLRDELTVSNTIDFGGGVSPTPTISLGIAMTMAVPEELPIIAPTPTPLVTPFFTPLATPLATPIAVVQQTTPTLAAQQDPIVGTIVGAVIGSLVGLAVVIPLLVVCVIIVVKKRERNQLGFRKKKAGELDEFDLQRLSNAEPLLAQPPPEGPPPVLSGSPPEVGERLYNAPSSEEPMPYEEARKTMPRYAGQPQRQVKQHSQSVRNTKTESYYARPRFYKPGRLSSTSTHIYGDLDELSKYDEETVSASALETMYISSRQLEPYLPKAKDQEVTEKELMLTDIESSQATTDFVPSGSEEGSLSSEFVPSGSEEGSLDDGLSEEDETGHTLVKPSSWLGKSPATGQSDSILLISNNAEPKYINTTRRTGRENLDSSSHNYVNAREAVSQAVAGVNLRTRSTPATKKTRKKKFKRNKSTPSAALSENSEYMELTRETANYTSVYASTIKHGQNEDLSAWAEN